jgi:excisionase family DNA binding protein
VTGRDDEVTTVAIETLLLRVTEVAKMLGVSRAKVYELIADGRLRSVRLDGGVAGSASTICTITSRPRCTNLTEATNSISEATSHSRVLVIRRLCPCCDDLAGSTMTRPSRAQ